MGVNINIKQNKRTKKLHVATAYQLLKVSQIKVKALDQHQITNEKRHQFHSTNQALYLDECFQSEVRSMIL